MDIDLAGRTNNQLDHIKKVVIAVCGVAADLDGIEFNRDSIRVGRIQEDDTAPAGTTLRLRVHQV